MIKRYVFAFFVVLTASVHASSIEYKTVSVSSVGSTEREAIDNALVRAIERVNGQEIDSRRAIEQRVLISSGDEGSTMAVDELTSKSLRTSAKGFIKSWRLLSSASYDAHSHKVRIEADIAVLKKPKSINRMKLAVVQKGMVDKSEGMQSTAQSGDRVVIMIDSSGSMRGKPFSSATRALASVVDSALGNHQEVALLFWSGPCGAPKVVNSGFSTDKQFLLNFADKVVVGSGTPLGDAIVFGADLFGSQKGGTVIFLADGQSSCGDEDLTQALQKVKSRRQPPQYQTIGFNIAKGSKAEMDLQRISSETAGLYSHVVESQDLALAFNSSLSKSTAYRETTPYLAKKITAMLVNSRKFAVLDRLNSEAIHSELSRVKKTGKREDLVRLNQEVLPDYLVVLDEFSGDDDRVIHMEMSVIDYATRQVTFVASEKVRVRPSDDKRKRNHKTDLSLNKLYKKLVDKVAIPLVLSYENDIAYHWCPNVTGQKLI